ncbi:MAG: hypothetical protein QHH15_00260 [Candidatus Thermoplasmatota archaeon]|nr:hypothetical protein [Candidatus Thermoplasmatota archaeon]
MTGTSERKLEDVVKDIKIEDTQDAIELIKAKKVKRTLENERKRLRDINKCLSPDCDGSFGDFEIDRLLQKGRKSYRLECEKCHRMHRLLIIYNDEPGLEEGEITITPLEYAWRTNHPAKMTEEQLSIWVNDESEKVVENRSVYMRRDEQLLIRTLNMVRQKVDELIKTNKQLDKKNRELESRLKKVE